MDQNFLFTLKLAKNGHANSQYLVGLYYEAGTGCARDYYKAYYWFEKAAKQNHHFAQYSQGMYCMDGQGCEIDTALGIQLLTLSSKAGNKYATYVLGTSLYKSGKPNEGFTLIKQAANKGHIKAKFFLAYCYAEGKACQKDIDKSFKLWQEASFEEMLQSQ